jgi:HD superfamily phosphohydrolase
MLTLTCCIIKKRLLAVATQEFLYDVVNNTRSGLDVDKLDYFRRDCINAGVKLDPDVDRLFKLARSV